LTNDNPTDLTDGPDDVAQTAEITLELEAGVGAPTEDEMYSITLTRANGLPVTATYTAQAGDDLDDVANGLITNGAGTGLNDLIGTAGTNEFTFVLGASTGVNDLQTIEITDVIAEDGGFTITTLQGSAGITSVSFSSLLSTADGTPTLDEQDPDIITDFMSGDGDSISFTDLLAGSGTNYAEDDGTQVTTFQEALDAANTAMNQVVTYYFTSANVAGEDIGMLFVDANADGDADGVVQLTGVTSADFSATDIM